MDLAAHAVASAGVAVQTQFGREVAVLVRPAGRQDSGRTFQIAAVEIKRALSVRGRTLGFGREDLLEGEAEIGAPGVAHGELEHRTQLHAVSVNGVVAHVRSAHVAFAGNVKALVALSVIEVGQEHARANRLRQIPVVVGTQMCAPVDPGSVVVNIGSGNVRVELVAKQTDLDVPREVQAFEQILAAEAKGTATDAQGSFDLNSSDLEGSTGILSAGWTYQDGNFSTELGLNGYAGTRNGVSGQIQANWKF